MFRSSRRHVSGACEAPRRGVVKLRAGSPNFAIVAARDQDLARSKQGGGVKYATGGHTSGLYKPSADRVIELGSGEGALGRAAAAAHDEDLAGGEHGGCMPVPGADHIAGGSECTCDRIVKFGAEGSDVRRWQIHLPTGDEDLAGGKQRRGVVLARRDQVARRGKRAGGLG